VGETGAVSDSTVLTELLDREAIRETVYRYATGLDTKDFELYRSIFTDRVRIDFSSWNGRAPAEVDAEDWVDGVRVLFTGLDASQHSMTNPTVTVDGDTATCVMYMQAEHFLHSDRGDASFAIGGYYTDELVRSPAGWRLSAVALTVLWRRGNEGVMAQATERGRQRLGP
jgi:SnoaL-like domain